MVQQVSNNKVLSESIKIIPLGGVGQIGKNMMVVELDEDIIIIDCGVMFPDENLHGVDLVIPDMNYVVERKARVKAVLITHGHEDHIGALPYLLAKMNVPVYGSKLSIELIKARLDETLSSKGFNLQSIPPRKKMKLGGMSFEFIRTNHSIADSYAVAIHTRIGTIIHTGDFKVDLSPVDGKAFDLYRFASLGENGVLALFSDSTNVEREGFSMSEREISANLFRTIEEARGRIIVATFSSNIHRLGQLISIARQLNKKIAVAGKSMNKYVGIAAELGYFSVEKGFFIELEDLDKYPREETIIVATGSQGEPMSALTQISHDNHRFLKAEKNDTVIISASVVPGNEKMVSRVIDRLFRIGATVIYEGSEDIHASGHGSQEELKLMLALTKPKFFMPIHGDFRHLVHHASLAEQMGIGANRIIIAQDGDVIELNNNEIRKVDTIVAEPVYVDGKIVGDVGSQVMMDRQMMSGDGIVIAVIPYHHGLNQFGNPDIITRGFIYVREAKDIIKNAKQLINEKCTKFIEERNLENDDYSILKNQLKITLKQYFYSETERNPLILIRVVTF